MRTFTFCLKIEVDARDHEEALDIAHKCKYAVQARDAQPYIVKGIEIDDLEEL